jgi:hypothetical protein
VVTVQWLCKVLVLVSFNDGLSGLVLECNKDLACGSDSSSSSGATAVAVEGAGAVETCSVDNSQATMLPTCNNNTTSC